MLTVQHFPTPYNTQLFFIAFGDHCHRCTTPLVNLLSAVPLGSPPRENTSALGFLHSAASDGGGSPAPASKAASASLSASKAAVRCYAAP